MIVQIEQSGKLEKTNQPTVVGFSNGKSGTVTISGSEKLKLKQHFRQQDKRQAYIYKSFAALIFLLLRDEKTLDLAIIDTEYPGQEPIIKSYLLNFMRGYGREDLNKSSFVFKRIGKSSPAHRVAHDAFTGKTTAKELSAKEIIDLVN